MSFTTSTGWDPYFGKYVIFGELGRGGMGVVYAARDPELDRLVALKVLHSNMAATPEAVHRLRLEAEAASRLDHPHIVPIYAVGEQEGQPFLAMGLIEGESLAEKISRSGPFPPREGAALATTLARAVQHAHDRGVLHRDLKPANILLDTQGEPHLSDFGLAKCLDRAAELTLTGSFIGTPAYASPEQAAGKSRLVTTASDVYSLGAILYAILTGRPPFTGETASEIIQQVQDKNPIYPRALCPQVPANLETICLKCLEKERTRRYSSALLLAEDLERFSSRKPILARDTSVAERLCLWARRKPVHAGLIASVVLLVLTAAVGGMMWNQARDRARQHESLIQQLALARLTPRNAGWSEKAWEKARLAAATDPGGADELRDQATAIMADLDAHPLRQFTNFISSSVVFNRDGSQVLVGGLNQATRLWDLKSGKVEDSPPAGFGPVGFGPKGEALQCIDDEGSQRLILRRADSFEKICDWKMEFPVTTTAIGKADIPLLALAKDSSLATAALNGRNGQGIVGVFTRGSDVVETVETFREPVAALTISADASLIAAAEMRGSIHVWSTRTKSRIATIPAERGGVSCLRLSRSRRTSDRDNSNPGEGWLLAAGGGGGEISIWDLAAQQAVSRCHSGSYDVYALDFSPDGATLASGGHGSVDLWDTATGLRLLSLEQEFVASLAFSPDGDQLLVGETTGFAPAQCRLYCLEPDRGVHVLRGLAGKLHKICFSPDNRLVAALSGKWEIGVWKLKTGELLRVFEAPWGENCDNAALAFTHNGQHLAFSGHRSARVWNVISGARQLALELPCGLAENFGAPDDSHLLLFRAETLDEQACPYGGGDRAAHPIVCRIRDLLNPGLTRTLRPTLQFTNRILGSAAILNGQVFVVSGAQEEGNRRSGIMAFDGLNGTRLWQKNTGDGDPGSGTLGANATCFAAYLLGPASDIVLFEISSGRKDSTRLPRETCAAYPELGLYALSTGDRSGGFTIMGQGNRRLVKVGIGSGACSPPQFDSTGNLFAWGNRDGSVTVCDLKEIRRRLKGLGLAW